MSDYDDYDEENEDSGTSPKSLRAALNKANKILAELKSQNEALTGQVNESRLASLLSTKKVSPSIQRWIKKDGVEPTAEAVDKWLAENGEDFGWKPGGETQVKENDTETKHESSEEQPRTERRSVLTDEDIAALERVQALAGQGSGPVYHADQDKATVDRIAQGLDPLDYDGAVAQLKAAGIEIESAH